MEERGRDGVGVEEAALGCVTMWLLMNSPGRALVFGATSGDAYDASQAWNRLRLRLNKSLVSLQSAR